MYYSQLGYILVKYKTLTKSLSDIKSLKSPKATSTFVYYKDNSSMQLAGSISSFSSFPIHEGTSKCRQYVVVGYLVRIASFSIFKKAPIR